MSEPLRLCLCGKRLNRLRMRKHIITMNDGSRHTDVEWLLGHLIIRGNPADAERIRDLRSRLQPSE